MYRSDDPGVVEHFFHLCPGSNIGDKTPLGFSLEEEEKTCGLNNNKLGCFAVG